MLTDGIVVGFCIDCMNALNENSQTKLSCSLNEWMLWKKTVKQNCLVHSWTEVVELEKIKVLMWKLVAQDSLLAINVSYLRMIYAYFMLFTERNYFIITALECMHKLCIAYAAYNMSHTDLYESNYLWCLPVGMRWFCFEELFAISRFGADQKWSVQEKSAIMSLK